MAVCAGIGRHVLEAGSIVPLEGVQMAGTAYIALLALEQAFVIAGMGGMTGCTAIFPISDQMIVGRRHLLADLIMTLQAGVDTDRNTFTGMAVLAAGSVGFMQNIANQTPIVTPMRVMTGSAAFHLGRVAGMFLLHRLGRMAAQAKFVGLLDKQGRVG
jgi:hypothetical protein